MQGKIFMPLEAVYIMELHQSGCYIGSELVSNHGILGCMGVTQPIYLLMYLDGGRLCTRPTMLFNCLLGSIIRPLQR